MDARKRHVLIRYLGYAKPYRWMLAVVILTGVAKFTLPLIPADIIRRIVDKVMNNTDGLGDNERIRLLWTLGAVLLGVMVLESLAIYFRGIATVKVASSIVFDLRQALWRHLQRLHLGFHQSRPTGTILSRLMSDISVSQQMINGGICNVVIDAISGAAALAMLLTISWKLALLVLAVLPLYGIVYRRINPQIRQVSHEVQEQTSVISGTAVERLSGIAVVQSFAQERSEERNFASQGGELRELSVRRGKLNQMLKAGSEFLVGTAGRLVWVIGALLVVTGSLSPGRVVQFVAVAALLYLPMRRFSEINIIYQNSMAAIERVFAIFDITPEVADRPGVADSVPGLGEVEFDHVGFRYTGDGAMVLQDVSFRVLPGEKVAIVGESGAGKSTLVTLVSRLHDVTDGAIRVDGLDVRDYRLRSLRRGIGIVLQDTILFSGTIRENLRYGRKKATDEEIVAAARAANAHEFIQAMDDGYDSFIGERGISLSGGQRQRISIARTILQDPRILIFDEATSSLDSETENQITEALERVMVGRTCFIIAHRLSTIMGADRILVFRAGRLVEAGPHAELLEAGRYYRFLFEQQFAPLQELLEQSRIGRK